MFLLAYIIFFLNIVFIIRVLAGICDVAEYNSKIDDNDDIMRDFIGKNKTQNKDEPETYEDFGTTLTEEESHEE